MKKKIIEIKENVGNKVGSLSRCREKLAGVADSQCGKAATVMTVIIAAILVLMAFAMFGVQKAVAEEEGLWNPRSPQKFSIEEYVAPTYPWQEMGYESIYDYDAELNDKRSEAEEIAQSAIETYADVISDEQKELLESYENEMRTAQTIEGYDSAMAEFESILSELQELASELAYEEPVYYEQAYVGDEYASSYCPAAAVEYCQNGGGLTKSGGVNWYNGRKETWYSQRVLPGGGLNIPGRHVASDGTVRDADGYIVVAASDLAYGSVVDTSLGQGKVYDTGCAPGTSDIYTDW